MAQSKYTGRTGPLLAQTGIVAAFLIAAGVVAVEQSAHADGIVRCWGSNGDGQCNTPADLGPCSSIAGGGYHTIALRSDGGVRCWGYNGDGQCNTPADLGPCSSVAGGARHTIALRSDGSVRCWGRNNNGQCNTPADLGPCSSIAGGSYHTIALRIDGGVRCWGFNNYGQCYTPADLGPCSSIAGGGYHTIALRIDGTVRVWGGESNWDYLPPADLGACSSVAGGGFHTIAIRSDGSVRCWGYNNSGQCNTPADLGACSRIVGGARHTIAITNPDCNNNGISDFTELAGNDCDTNGIHDSCQIASQTLEDCNSNGLADQCEKELQISIASERFATVGYGYNKVWTVSNVVRAQSVVTLTIRGHGDFSAAAEYVHVRAGSSFDAQALGGTFDCAAGVASTTILTLSPQQFNTLISADGALRLSMEPSIAVNPNLCADGTWIEATLDYIGPRPADCNANGLLDSCEIAAGYSPDSNQNGVVDTCESLLLECPTDFNQSGATDGSDLGILLGQWATSGGTTGADINADGTVNGADLGLILGAWGPCPN